MRRVLTCAWTRCARTHARRILCAVDRRPARKRPSAAALALADEHHAALRLSTSSIGPSAETFLPSATSPSPPRRHRRPRRSRKLCALLPKEALAWRQGCRAWRWIARETILDAAREWGCGPDRPGPAAARGLSAAVMGSTTETVVRRADGLGDVGGAVVTLEEHGGIVLRWQRVR